MAVQDHHQPAVPGCSLGRGLPRRAPRRLLFALCAVLLSVALPTSAEAPIEAHRLPESLSRSDWQSIQDVYRAGRHAVVASADQPGTWQARNPGQKWLTRFDGRGFVAEPDHGLWQWGLELRHWGYQGDPQSIDVSAQAQVRVDGGHTVYHWGGGLEEWFVNDPRGLEHGYTVRERPPGAGDTLRFELAVRGALSPSIDESARDVAFVDASGTTVLTYSGLKAWDADGKPLASAFAPAGERLALSVDATGARYPITIDPLAQQAYLKASNADAGDRFGVAIAVSGDTVVVGATGEASGATGVNGDQADNSTFNAGAAYVFVRSGSGWTQQAYLKASNTDAEDGFGASVSVSGDTVVVGAAGEASNAIGVGGNQADNSASNAGAAYVFVRGGSDWTQQAYLKASNTAASDRFGVSVAVSGDTVIVGADGEDSNATGIDGAQADDSASNAGAAYVFTRSGNSWTQQAYLKASNTDQGDSLGISVAISGDTAVVGSSLEDSNATGIDGDQADNSAVGSGAAYVFIRSGSSWTQQAYLKASNTDGADQFGFSVAISDDTVLVGAPAEDSSATGVDGNQSDNAAPAAGAAYAFIRSGSNWTQQAYLKASTTDTSDQFGISVAVSGDSSVVGAPGEASSATGVDGNQADNSAVAAGAAYAFARSGSSWTQQAYLKASNTDADDRFGIAVTVSGATVMAGAFGEDSNATGVNGNQADNSASTAGATYVFGPTGFTIGGTVTGLSGIGLVLRNNAGDDLTIASNGAFTFATPVAGGAAYAVTVLTQPGNPAQVCTVSNGVGTVLAAIVTDVAVDCTATGSPVAVPTSSPLGLLLLSLLMGMLGWAAMRQRLCQRNSDHVGTGVTALPARRS